jgi:hypothetical protein
MIRGNIAIPGKDPKTWRAKGRKKRSQPAIASAIVTPGKPKRRSSIQSEMEDGYEQPQRPAIVEPKRKPNTMLAHLLADITDEERNRRADLADAMFREIKRRAALPPDGS